MPYTPVDVNRNRLKASAAPKQFDVKPQQDLSLRIYTLELTDDGSPDYSKRVSTPNYTVSMNEGVEWKTLDIIPYQKLSILYSSNTQS